MVKLALRVTKERRRAERQTETRRHIRDTQKVNERNKYSIARQADRDSERQRDKHSDREKDRQTDNHNLRNT